MATTIETTNIVTTFVTEIDSTSAERAARQAKKSTDKIEKTSTDSFRKIKRQSDRTFRNLDKGVKDGFKKADREVKRGGSGIEKSLKGIATRLAAVGIGAAIGRLFTGAINEAAKFEQVTQSFEVLIGDAARAKELIDELNEFSLSTPFTPDEIQQSAKTLLGFGRSVEIVKEDIELIGNAAAATGSDLQSLAVVYGQVAGLGKLQSNDALQFINQELPIYQLLGESLGKSTAELRKLQQQGKITFDDLRAAFKLASEEGGRFDGALEKQSKTLIGLQSTLRGYVQEVARNIGNLFLDDAKGIVDRLITIARSLNQFLIDQGSAIRRYISDVASSFARAFEPAISSIRELFKQFGNTSFFDGFNRILNRTIQKFRLVSLVIGSVVDRITDVVTSIRSVSANIPVLEGVFSAFLKTLLNFPAVLIATIAATQSAIDQYVRRLELAVDRLLLVYNLGLEKVGFDRGNRVEELRVDITYNELLNRNENIADVFKDTLNAELDANVEFIFNDINENAEETKKLIDSLLEGLDLGDGTGEIEAATGSVEDLQNKIKELQSAISKSNDPVFIEQATRDILKLNDDLERTQFLIDSIGSKLSGQGIESLSLDDILGGFQDNNTTSPFANIENEQIKNEVEDYVNRYKKAIAQVTGDEDEFNGILNEFLKGQGFDDQQRIRIIDAANQLYGELLSLADNFVNERERLLDREVDVAQERVDRLLSTYSDASAEQINIELSRLDEATKAREEAAKKRATAAKIEAAAYVLAAIARVAAESGISALGTVPALIVTLGTAAAAAAAIFHEGTDAVSKSDVGRRAPRRGLRQNEVPAILEEGERVIKVSDNKKLSGMSNSDLVKNALIGQSVRSRGISPTVMRGVNEMNNYELRGIRAELKEVKKAIGGIRFEASQNIDMSGLHQSLKAQEKRQDRINKMYPK